jgi:ribosomal protein L11 methyltransferase
VGRRTVIVPSWREYAPQPGEIIVSLDPGMAFGTGLHPTTRLCLVELEERLVPGMRVLDLGTGSGILAIAAARLGAGTVLALDTDRVAAEVALANVAANGVANVVQVGQGTLTHPDATLQPLLARPWDLVVANIIAQVLVDLAGPLADAVAPGGLLVASGIINERAADVESSLLAQRLTLLDRRTEGDWVTLVATKPRS